MSEKRAKQIRRLEKRVDLSEKRTDDLEKLLVDLISKRMPWMRRKLVKDIKKILLK